MDKSTAIKLFIKKTTIQFMVLALVCAAVFYFFAQQHYFSLVPFIFIYFYTINVVSYTILIKSHDLGTGKFSRRFMVITLIKFLGSLVFVALFIIFMREYVIPFLVIFIILYFLSLFQTVREFLGFIKQKTNS
ncbi:MAG: hypothetical protein WC951_00430 [Bacteroidales bacterium]|nr:hypothetical protein [Tenuifilaceae bacterium]